MDLKTALKIKEAVLLLEREGIPVQRLYEDKRIKEASKLWGEFYKADIKERGKIFGYNIVNYLNEELTIPAYSLPHYFISTKEI